MFLLQLLVVWNSLWAVSEGWHNSVVLSGWSLPLIDWLNWGCELWHDLLSRVWHMHVWLTMVGHFWLIYQ